MVKEAQHTVSRFYLRGFTPKLGEKTFWQHNRRSRRIHRVSPSKATTSSHFYSVRLPDGNWDDSIEDWLQDIETAAAPALKSLAAGTEPDSQSRVRLAAFIGAMLYRTTWTRQIAGLYAEQFQAQRLQSD